VSKFYYGGQAVIEGVMMRGQKEMAVAVRSPKGDIVVHREPLNGAFYTKQWARWPFVRGLVVLWDALVLGTKALTWSADVAVQEDGEDVSFSGAVAWGTIALSLAIGVGVFFLLPSAVAKYLEGPLGISPVVSALVEGAIRLALFLVYLIAIGLMPDIRRVFAYHGAEHKTINAYEAGEVLTPQNTAKYSTAHTRCGTTFLLDVLVLSILLFAPLQFHNLFFRLLSRLLLVPVVASVAYEFIRLSADHQDNWLMRALIKPGLWLQSLTTREPDLEMLEVGIAALKPVLEADGIILDASIEKKAKGIALSEA
jgi:uncharacterized protein YqhQ